MSTPNLAQTLNEARAVIKNLASLARDKQPEPRAYWLSDLAPYEQAHVQARTVERWLLSALLQEPWRISEVECQREDFFLTDHALVFDALPRPTAFNPDKLTQKIDLTEVYESAISIAWKVTPFGNGVGFSFLVELRDEPGVCPERAAHYSREVAKGRNERLFWKAHESLTLCDPQKRREILARMLGLCGVTQ